MPKTRKRFDAETEIRKYFLSAVKKVTGLIPLMKEEANLKYELAELGRVEKIITEEIKSLKVSIKLVKKDEIKKAIEEIISLKEKELEENEKKSDNLTEQLNECTDEISDYESYINRIYLFTDEFDMIYDDEIGFEKFSRDEFIAYVFLRTDCGREAFPSYIRDDISEVVHEVLGYLRRNGWNSFLEWVAKNN